MNQLRGNNMAPSPTAKRPETTGGTLQPQDVSSATAPGPIGQLLWQEAQGRQRVWRTAGMWCGAMAEALDRGRIIAEEEAELCYALERKVLAQHHVLLTLGTRPFAISGAHRPMPLSFANQ
eukprot:EG_transcript_43332